MTGRRPFPRIPPGRRFRPVPALVLLLALAAGGAAPASGPGPDGDAPAPRAVVWVFFRDHALPDPAAEERAIVALNRRPARPPRAGQTPRPADRRDLPVPDSYLAELRRRGAAIRQTTRWLNGVSIEIDPARLDEIARLPFVRGIEPVRRSRRPRPIPAASRHGRDGAPDGSILDPGLETWAARERPVDDRPSAPQRGRLHLNPPAASAGPAPLNAADEALFYGPSLQQDLQIGIVELHRRGYTGAGVVVAIFDSGFRTGHPALAGRRRLATRDFVFGDSIVDNEPADAPGAWNHGTSVWSDAGGYAPGALIGGGYEASFLLAKTEDIRSETPVEEDNYVAALEWADSLGADIVSASLVYLDFDGTTGDYGYAQLDGNTTVTARAVDIAVERGVCVVNAAGNFGPGAGTIWTPADADSVLSIGAVDSTGLIASFSSRGPTADGRIKPEVMARGVSNYVASAVTMGFGPGSGTSFATPMVAGAAALLKEAHPDWSGFQLREALRATASHPDTPDNDSGYGLVNVRAAADLAPAAPPVVSRPFSLRMPPRGATVSTTAPLFAWESSRPGLPADQVFYRVVLSTSPTMAPADTFMAGADTTWSPPFFLGPGTTWYWTVLAENQAGWTRPALWMSQFTVSSAAAVTEGERDAASVRMSAPWPNPSGGSLQMEIALPARAEAGHDWRLDLLSVDGRRLRRVAEGEWPTRGLTTTIAWDGRGAHGSPLPAGVYFLRLQADGVSRSERIIRLGSR